MHYAVVCARGLGDALLSMILAHNLIRSGFQAALFSDVLCGMREWFPEVDIHPFPTNPSIESTFASFTTIISADHSLIHENDRLKNRMIVLKESDFNKQRTMVENLSLFCAQKLHLPFHVQENGIRPLQGLHWRAHSRRVLIHPTSSQEKKNWPAHKFLALASALQDGGYEPFFCMHPQEKHRWKSCIDPKFLASFPTLSALASFVYESGYLIGNDSGLGHLASNLGIPTLSLFARRSYSQLWRPGWSFGLVAAPPNVLLGAGMKQKYWKHLLSIRTVKKQFYQLTEKVSESTM